MELRFSIKQCHIEKKKKIEYLIHHEYMRGANISLKNLVFDHTTPLSITRTRQ